MADGSLEHAAQVADVDGHGEDDGGVVLGRYNVQKAAKKYYNNLTKKERRFMSLS